MPLVMNGGKNKGYTVIEVMIFLAVSGVMFVIAAVFISGKQASAQFTQGVDELASNLRTLVQEVSNGQYPDVGIPYSCTPSSPRVSISGTSGTAQGTRSNCLYLGKIVQFKVKDTAGSGYNVFSIAGQRLDSSGNPVATLGAANPGPIRNTTDNIETTQAFTIPQGLSVETITFSDGASGYGVGFLNTPAIAGAQTVGLYADNMAADLNRDGAVSSIGWSYLTPVKKACIVVTNGSRKATVIVGASNNSLAVYVNRAGAITC
jgi:hypothetical protein